MWLNQWNFFWKKKNTTVFGHHDKIGIQRIAARTKREIIVVVSLLFSTLSNRKICNGSWWWPKTSDMAMEHIVKNVLNVHCTIAPIAHMLYLCSNQIIKKKKICSQTVLSMKLKSCTVYNQIIAVYKHRCHAAYKIWIVQLIEHIKRWLNKWHGHLFSNK